jgi:hypothetical protein
MWFQPCFYLLYFEEEKDPESQTKQTDPALDPELLDYNPQNQQRPTTSPNNKPQQSNDKAEGRSVGIHVRCVCKGAYCEVEMRSERIIIPLEMRC